MPKNVQKIRFGIHGSYRTEPKHRYSVNSVRFGRTLPNVVSTRPNDDISREIYKIYSQYRAMETGEAFSHKISKSRLFPLKLKQRRKYYQNKLYTRVFISRRIYFHCHHVSKKIIIVLSLDWLLFRWVYNYSIFMFVTYPKENSIYFLKISN